MTQTKRRHAPFSTGKVIATPGALRALDPGRLLGLLARHAKGDWGVIDETDREANRYALRNGMRVMSVYAIDPTQPCAGFGDNTIWVITEADRSATTFLLPEEY